MRITTRKCTSLDAFVTTPDGLRLIVLPRLVGSGRQLGPDLGPSTPLALDRHTALPNGVVELVYTLGS